MAQSSSEKCQVLAQGESLKNSPRVLPGSLVKVVVAAVTDKP